MIHGVVSAASRAAVVLEGFGQPRAAAVLAGAASVGPYSSLLLYNLDARARDELEDAILRLRATLGENEFDTEAARGAALGS